MTAQRFAVLLVDSTQHAMRAEALLRNEGILCKLIPVPRRISSECGICVRVPASRLVQSRLLLEQAGLSIASVHFL